MHQSACYDADVVHNDSFRQRWTTIRNDRIISLAAVPITVIDINEGTATITIIVQQALMTWTSQITPVADTSSQSMGDDKLK